MEFDATSLTCFCQIHSAHIPNVISTCLKCNNQTQTEYITNVSPNCPLIIPHQKPTLKVLTVYPHITCELHFAGTFGMCIRCKHYMQPTFSHSITAWLNFDCSQQCNCNVPRMNRSKQYCIFTCIFPNYAYALGQESHLDDILNVYASCDQNVLTWFMLVASQMCPGNVFKMFPVKNLNHISDVPTVFLVVYLGGYIPT